MESVKNMIEDAWKARPFWRLYPPNPPGFPYYKVSLASKYSSEEIYFGASGLDLPVLRYADIVLLRAETLYNLNQPDLAFNWAE